MNEWRPTRYRGYFANADGQILGLSGKILATKPNAKGYSGVSIHADCFRTRGFRNVSVHRLACEAFHGPRPVGKVVRHRDGNPSNNSATNLCWGTNSENQRDRMLHGTDPRGEKSPAAKLSNVQAREIRAKYAAGGYSHRSLGEEYGVKPQVVFAIVNNRTYRDA